MGHPITHRLVKSLAQANSKFAFTVWNIAQKHLADLLKTRAVFVLVPLVEDPTTGPKVKKGLKKSVVEAALQEQQAAGKNTTGLKLLISKM